MARVFFPENLRQFTHGRISLTIAADTYRDLDVELDKRFPGISKLVGREMMVAIDGEIVAEPFLEPLEADTEVHFLYRLGGG